MAFRNSPVAFPVVTQYQLMGVGVAAQSYPLDTCPMGGTQIATLVADFNDGPVQILEALVTPDQAYRLHSVCFANLTSPGTASLCDSTGDLLFAQGTQESPYCALEGTVWTESAGGLYLLVNNGASGGGLARATLLYDYIQFPVIN